MKLLSPAEKAVASKDFGDVWCDRTTRATLILVPLLMVIVLPVLFLVLIVSVPTAQMNGIDEMMKMLPDEAKGLSERQSMFYLLTNMVCPMFFLMIPLMSSSVSAACSFVGERERGTLETLLLTPLTVRQLFKAKVFGCLFLSGIATAVSFLGFAVVISVGDLVLGLPFFLNWNWLVLLFLLSPAVTVFGVVFMVLISGKSRSYTESVQTSGYIVLPVILLFAGQMTGLFRISAMLLLLVSGVVFAADLLLFLVAARRTRLYLS